MHSNCNKRVGFLSSLSFTGDCTNLLPLALTEKMLNEQWKADERVLLPNGSISRSRRSPSLSGSRELTYPSLPLSTNNVICRQITESSVLIPHSSFCRKWMKLTDKVSYSAFIAANQKIK